jgi:hypothetical protein
MSLERPSSFEGAIPDEYAQRSVEDSGRGRPGHYPVYWENDRQGVISRDPRRRHESKSVPGA